MIVNNRLKKVGDLVEENKTILDIGCDHAFLDIYLAQKKNLSLKRIIASDNKKGPLEQAEKNIKTHKLTNKIELKLGDGLDVYEKDINTVIISGMGGRNMIGIFKNNIDSLKTIDTIIISPNNYQIDIKKFLVKMNFLIEDEYLIKEGKIIYQIIKFKKGQKKYSKKEYFFGPILLKRQDDIFKEYYTRELKSREILLQILPRNYFSRRLRLKREIKLIKKELEK